MLFRFQPEDIEKLQSFVDEAAEYLQTVEEEALRLVTSLDVMPPLGNIFRQIHTVKCLSAFFGLSPITDLSYQAEFMLDAMRKGQLTPNSYSIGLLLDTKDMLIGMIKQLGSHCQNANPEVALEIALECPDAFGRVVEAMKCLVEGQQEKPSGALNQGKIESCIAADLDIAELAEKVTQGMLEDFLIEADEHGSAITDQFLSMLDADPEDANTLAEVFRRVHTIKGHIGLLLSVKISSVLQALLKNLQQVFQNLESLLAQTCDAKIPVASTVANLCFAAMDALLRVTTMLRAGCIKPDDYFLVKLLQEIQAARRVMDGNVAMVVIEPILNGEKLDKLMNVVGELTITKNVVSRIARKLMLEHNLPQMAREIKDAGQFITRISEELEDAIMSMRMTEVRSVFQKFPRIVRDIALQTGKKITLAMEGEETKLDKNIIEQIGDPLMHLVRNAVDHGIEMVEDRLGSGKDPKGWICLRAYNRGKSIIIEVEDDGKGMDPAILRNKAIEKGFISAAEAEGLSDDQCYQLIFLPGFSTAGQISEISGCGVGMDVVRSNITALQGSIRIASQLGQGSRIAIQLPLTLIVSKGLLVESSGQALIIPLDNVIETLKAPAQRFVSRKGKKMLHHRGEVLGIVSLAELLGMSAKAQEISPTVIIGNGDVKVGLIVDKLFNEQDILVKPLPEYLSNLPAMDGATILGDGKVALVLNAPELIGLAQG